MACLRRRPGETGNDDLDNADNDIDDNGDDEDDDYDDDYDFDLQLQHPVQDGGQLPDRHVRLEEDPQQGRRV